MRWPVGGKIISGFGVLVVLIALLAFAHWREGERVELELDHLYRSGVEGTQELGEARALLQRIRGRVFVHVASTDPAEKQDLEREIADWEEQMMAALERARRIAEQEAAYSTDYQDYQSRIDTIRQRYTAFAHRLDAEVFPASRMGDTASALTLIADQAGPVFTDTATALQELITDHVTGNQRIYQTAIEILESASRASLWTSVLASLLAVLVGWLLTRNIAHRLRRVAAAAGRVSRGELENRVRVRGNDEITDVATAVNGMADALAARIDEARAATETQARERQKLVDTITEYGGFVARVARGELNAELTAAGNDDMVALGRNLAAMGKALRTMTLRTHDAVGALSAASAEILTTVQEHGASASESASAVAETAATVDEVHHSAQRVAEQAERVAEASKQSVEVSSAGREAVEHTVGSMRDLREQVDAIAERILLLSEQAQAVSQIITSVNELAEQSNLLALNASIEAARAGDEGRGFAVVAREIRALADQSRAATAQVRTILGDIQKSTTQAVLETERGSHATAQAEEAVRTVGVHIDRLAETIGESAQVAQHIQAAAEQQVLGVSQISQAMRSITDASRQTVEGTRNVERAVRDLNQLSGDLRDAVAQYRL